MNSYRRGADGWLTSGDDRRGTTNGAWRAAVGLPLSLLTLSLSVSLIFVAFFQEEGFLYGNSRRTTIRVGSAPTVMTLLVKRWNCPHKSLRLHAWRRNKRNNYLIVSFMLKPCKDLCGYSRCLTNSIENTWTIPDVCKATSKNGKSSDVREASQLVKDASRNIDFLVVCYKVLSFHFNMSCIYTYIGSCWVSYGLYRVCLFRCLYCLNKTCLNLVVHSLSYTTFLY